MKQTMTGFHKCLILFITFTLRSTQAVRWSSGGDGNVKWASNCDFNGHVIGIEKSSGEMCGGLCFKRPECTQFTWRTGDNGGICSFRKGNGTAFYKKGGVCGFVAAERSTGNGITWKLADEDRIRWSYNCDITGHDVDAQKTIGENCGAACLEQRKCIGFVWTAFEGGTCRLKSNGHSITAYVGDGGVCGEIIGRRAPPASFVRPSNGFTRKSELACNDYIEIASHYRTIRGDPAQRNEFPWMAALGYRKNDKFIFRCGGGTIISDYFILTAAHCTETDPKPEIVRLGSNNLKDSKATEFKIESYFTHEQYSHKEFQNDIALVRVEQRITFNSKILPACLSVKRNDLPCSQAIVLIGWGMTEDGVSSDILQKTRLGTVKLETCKADYQSSGSEARIDDGHYCAVDPDHGVCAGNSGGPIFMFHDSPLPAVVAVASDGAGCAAKLPGVYARVSHYSDWIEDKVW